jgi:hypothetical protein
MSFKSRDIEYYDELPPWLRKLIAASELPLSAINVGEKLKKLKIDDHPFQVNAAMSIIAGEESAMRLYLQIKDKEDEIWRKRRRS